MKLDPTISIASLDAPLKKFWKLYGQKIHLLERSLDPNKGAPVFTEKGVYISRGWTEWTQGFQYGAALLQFDATGDSEFLEIGRKNTVKKMAPHLTHTGVRSP
jgi:hypothetical protein